MSPVLKDKIRRMKSIILIALTFITVSSCVNRNTNNIAYIINEKDLIPEGITYSSVTGSFYLGSINKKKIIQIDSETGEFRDFVPSDLLNLSYLGLLVDDSKSHLWACGFPYEGYIAGSMVAKFDLISGKLLKSYSFNDTVKTVYNDLVEDADGNIYFTDSEGQTVYKIDCRTDSVGIFFSGVEVLHPNGIAISPDQKYLYVASTSYGIRVLDIEKQIIIGNPDTVFNSRGIDGLKYFNNSLIGIQNEVETKSEVKIIRYFLDTSGTKVIDSEIIDQNNPNFDIPTTFVIAGQTLYCVANSQIWNMNSSENKILDRELLQDILILKYELH